MLVSWLFGFFLFLKKITLINICILYSIFKEFIEFVRIDTVRYYSPTDRCLAGVRVSSPPPPAPDGGILNRSGTKIQARLGHCGPERDSVLLRTHSKAIALTRPHTAGNPGPTQLFPVFQVGQKACTDAHPLWKESWGAGLGASEAGAGPL